jgi:hypothetical protein
MLASNIMLSGRFDKVAVTAFMAVMSVLSATSRLLVSDSWVLSALSRRASAWWATARSTSKTMRE